jgi:N-acetylmuramoyl-L-alanine amidase
VHSGWLRLAVILLLALLAGTGIGLGSYVATRGPAPVEVPSLNNQLYGDVSGQVTAAGLVLKLDPGQKASTFKEISKNKITNQAPEAGTLVKKGTAVTVTLEPDKAATAKQIVCLDPGHSTGGPSSEIDPASGLDVADNSGDDGEIQTNWDIAMKTKPLLEKEGYTVVLTRPTIDSYANLRQRADIGNSSDIMIRIHYDLTGVDAILYPGTGQTKSHGTSTLTVNPEISARSAVLANSLFEYLDKVGIKRVANDMSGSSNNTGGAYVGSVISKVPVVVIENDPNVVRNNPTGQEQVAEAISKGVKAYFNGL